MDVAEAIDKDKKTVLVIDNEFDEKCIEYLHQYNYTVKHLQASQVNLDDILYSSVDFLIMNWLSPQMNVKKVCQTAFQQLSIPLIITCQTPSEEDCIEALSSGADDFIKKPLNPRELHARMNAIERRCHYVAHAHKLEKFTFENWSLDLSSRILIQYPNKEVKLSVGEFDLLSLFAKNPQRVLSREELLEITKSKSLSPYDRSIDIQISRLRYKIEENPKRPMLIKTVRCGGYIFTPQVSQAGH